MSSVPPPFPPEMSAIDDDQRAPDYDTAPVALPSVAISRANRLGVRAAFARPAPTARAERLGVASSSSGRAARLGIGSSLARRAERLGLAPDVDDGDQEQSA